MPTKTKSLSVSWGIFARSAGFATIDGLAMLIGQAAAAFEMFFGATAPREFDAELRELLTA